MSAMVLIYVQVAAVMFLWLGFSGGAFEARANIYREVGGRTLSVAAAWFGTLAIACIFWPFTLAAWLLKGEEGI